ncbi:MAG: hypothetical protein COV47_03770 [Candidatus Diapherotrites archaeon CG11_big_fil_rev_8_21_14_0_20_37_9]|nr:MAG: hypothetical protein COV47_03770 [Candidatus Diapherotrites archaeon CG11_big_fil_rev_8_21_14_0_20_37_9]
MEKAITILVAVTFMLIVAGMLAASSGAATGTGFALLTGNHNLIDAYFDNGKLKQPVVDEINENLEGVPDQLFSFFGSDKINIYVTYTDGSVHDYWALTQDNLLVELHQGTKEDATIEIRINEKTVDRLFLSKKPFSEFLTAMNSGEIKYKGLNFEGKVKETTVGVTTTVVGAVVNVWDFFTGLFG